MRFVFGAWFCVCRDVYDRGFEALDSCALVFVVVAERLLFLLLLVVYSLDYFDGNMQQ